MVERYELFGPSQERFGNPAPLGLLGLAIGCAALVPVAFGVSVTPAALETASLYARGVDIHEQLALQKYVPPATAAH